MKKVLSPLKEAMWKQNISMQELADKAGINKRTLEPYTAGRVSLDNAQFWFVLRVADALGVDPHIFIENH